MIRTWRERISEKRLDAETWLGGLEGGELEGTSYLKTKGETKPTKTSIPL